ncbi:MAG: amino acid ABC transporter substrate-binding protein [Aquabacterium sp.]|nr:MAG: amino acid ABC transporter substrate-binding protein [Aquabacterium sp.]
MHLRLSAAFVLSLASLCASAAGTLDKIQSERTIAIGTRDASAPLAYSLGGGKYVGYHVEVCQRVADALRAQLKLVALTVNWQLVTSQNRLDLLRNGTIDLECGSTTNNRARQEQVGFAPTTFITNVRIAVRADSGISSIAQLAGKTVATTTGTTSVKLLRAHERAAGIDFKEVLGKDHAQSFLLLEQGQADAFVMDDNILAGNIANAKNPSGFRIVGESLSQEPIAIAYRKDDPAFKAAVDGAVRALMASGELERIYAKWFTSPIPPRNANVNIPMSPALKAAIAQPNDRPAEDYVRK